MTGNIVTTIDLMRHGEPVGGKKFRGQLDDPLSEKGWSQMREAVGDRCPWDLIVSSPLLRCADFARELAARHGRPLEFDARLMEIGFGVWEGRTPAELLQQDPQCLLRFRSDPMNNAPPGAESLAAFRERVIAAWDAALKRHAGRHLLMVGHAGMMRMIMREVLAMPLDKLFHIEVENACITRITVDHHAGGDFPRLQFHRGCL